MAQLNVGDIVSIRGQVVSVEDDAMTVEVADDDRKHRYNVTLNGGQITDAVTFVEKGGLPPPDPSWTPFGDIGLTADEMEQAELNTIIVEQADTIGIAESTT